VVTVNQIPLLVYCLTVYISCRDIKIMILNNELAEI
jgi:hypothetical protein